MTENDDMSKGVKMDSSTPDVTDVYDSRHGSYKNQEPAVRPVKPNDQISAPFRLGGG